MKLAALASIVRSKNAGPATLTLDIFLRDAESFARACAITRETVAERYGCRPAEVARYEMPAILALKFSLPRRIVAGSPGDTDVYGAQQHVPLLDLDL